MLESDGPGLMVHRRLKKAEIIPTGALKRIMFARDSIADLLGQSSTTSRPRLVSMRPGTGPAGQARSVLISATH